MKYILQSFVFLSALTLISCTPKTTEAPDENLADTTWMHDPGTEPGTDRWANPSETFTGTANGVQIKFFQKDYTAYRLIVGVDTTEGILNTERGFQNDEDATLYILYYEMPDSIQYHFVRMTDGRVMMLDNDRNALPDTEFRKG